MFESRMAGGNGDKNYDTTNFQVCSLNNAHRMNKNYPGSIVFYSMPKSTVISQVTVSKIIIGQSHMILTCTSAYCSVST